ncbi:translocation/assembly module TamB domain-containing protein [Carboxylicivirga sediminis]|uniref:Translocation/assembly module TamB domain-containing protein n=1 Tax=Carboxylicivirga sediminis TaxID=2006564 RepID=A0A941IY92_9BACT|nr:translocation/assembly module TamB domain-containing protein [Carboxylicivirga sediminis]MBR8536775.1 translocation/assembly module TamB domain-containing protein [Carboxylicivirga sediminis]
MVKKALRYTTNFISALLLLVVLLIAFTQTSLFRNIAKEKALQLVNARLNGELKLGELSGNLYNSLFLSDLALVEGDSVVFAIDSISIKYQLSHLIKKQVLIDSLLVYSPYFNLWYKDSSTLHVAYVFDPMQTKEKKTSSDFSWKIDADNIALIDGKGSLQVKYGQASLRLSDLTLAGNTSIAHKDVAVRANELTFEMLEPKFQLNKGFVQMRKQGNAIRVDSLLLQSAQSLLHGQGHYLAADDFDIALTGGPINSDEVKRFLPQLPLRTVPKMNVRLSAQKDNTDCIIRLENGRKSVRLNGIIKALPEAIFQKRSNVGYDLRLAFNQFVPEEWLDIKATNSHLNGSVAVDGVDLLDYKKELNLKARLNTSTYNGTVTDTLFINARQKSNRIDANVLIVYNKSRSQGQLIIKDLYKTPHYTANFNTNNLDVEAIEPNMENTIINGRIAIAGTNILSEPRHFNAEADLSQSKVFDYPIDSVFMRSELVDSLLQIDTCILVTDDNRVGVNGQFKLSDRAFKAHVGIETSSLKSLQQFGVPPVTFSRGTAMIQLDGYPDLFNYQGEVDFADIAYQELLSESVNATFSGAYKADSITSSGTINIRNVESGAMYLDSLTTYYTFNNNHLHSSIYFNNQDYLDGNIESNLILEDTVSLRIDQARLSLPIATYYLTDTLQSMQLYGKTLRVDNLEIKDEVDSSFYVNARGILSTVDSTDFELMVCKLNLLPLNRFVASDDTIDGLLSIHAVLEEQQAGGLHLSAEYDLESPKIGQILLPDAEGQVHYDTDTVKVNAWLPQLDSALHAQLAIPLVFGVDSVKGYFLEPANTFDAKVVVNALRFDTPKNAESGHTKAGVEFSGVVNGRGELTKPQFYGQINMKDGYITSHEKGLYYKGVAGKFNFKGAALSVDSLYVGADKGYFKSNGNLLFDSTIVSGKVIAADLMTDMRNFHVLAHKNYDINISGNPYYKTDSLGNPQFGGKVLVNRSTFNIPGLMDADNKQNQMKDLPLLVQALQEDDTIRVERETDEKSKNSPLLKQLRGRMTIEIPRSTWLKGENMNIEIGGDFDIAKTGDYFELFGDVDIIRGNYILYGRKFNINEGVITFMGGQKADPRLDISAEYVFRGGDREKHSLKLIVSEQLSEPTIAFTLDDNSITESDAVSIMVFGKTMDELSYSGQNGIIGSVGSNMLANMVTSSLNSTIGQRLKLDMIEVNATENWTSAAFVVGKYITNDLFVIYQRGFGETEDDEITPESITLEYEVSKLLFFRLQGGASKSSGFDVILKFESAK